MSLSNPERFPWGSNDPSRWQRVAVALLVSSIATALLYASFVEDPARHTDFSTVWFGAKMMLAGTNPYPLFGPGRAFDLAYPLLYPASSFVAVAPFAVLSEAPASLVFTALSVALMTYGITWDGWHRMPMIASAAFIDSVLAAQWTMIMTAALFLPWLAIITPAKPQTGIPILAAYRSSRALAAAFAGGILLTLISLVMLPGWPREWLATLRIADHMRSPMTNPAGLLVIPVLLRWRRPEAWLLFISACLPQTFMWYGALTLLAIAATYRQAVTISLISTGGYLLASYLVYAGVPRVGFFSWTIYISTTFWPCVWIVLRRPNDGEPPAWIKLLYRKPRLPGQQ